MFNYVKEHPFITMIGIGTTLFFGGAAAELAHTLTQYFMWLGGGLFVVGLFAGIGHVD